jgi:thimet oligopeptidase
VTDVALELRERARATLSESRARLAAFPKTPTEAAPEEVAARFDAISRPLNGVWERAALFVQVHPDPSVREAAREIERDLEAFGTELGLSRPAWQRLASIDPSSTADPLARRLLEHALRDYRRSGVDRPDAVRERVRALREELVRLGQEFEQNIVAGGRTFRVEDGHRGLAGLPADFLASHPEAADGSVTLGTDPADRIPMLTFAERDDVRAAYFIACQNRAVPQNLPVLPKLLARRHELATLLGHASWADYVTEDKMSKSAAGARSFLESVVARVRERADRELADLVAMKRERGSAHGGRGEPWVYDSERLFLVEKVKARRFRVDARDLRPYFAFDAVKRGVLATSEALFGVTIERVDDPDAWHPSVETYRIVEDGVTIARFHLDLHPRDGKYKHAAMFPLRSGLAREADGDRVLPEACLVCNFPEPKAGDPALLLHDEVTTFFHEVGHLLHHLFAGRQRYLRFSGITCEWDFVEVPSQLYEDWAWEADVLATFARHHETGEPIPRDLVERMRAAEEYGKGLHVLVQCYYGLLSLDLYERSPEGRDIDAVSIDLKRRILPLAHEEGNRFYASFGHLHGYSAMYYTYLWSLAIAKDVASRFDDRRMDPDVADKYRRAVLEPGGGDDAAKLVGAFLGRDAGLEAFERWLAR